MNKYLYLQGIKERLDKVVVVGHIIGALCIVGYAWFVYQVITYL